MAVTYFENMTSLTKMLLNFCIFYNSDHILLTVRNYEMHMQF